MRHGPSDLKQQVIHTSKRREDPYLPSGQDTITAVQTRGAKLGPEDYSGRPFGSIPDPVYRLLVARRWTEDTESEISSVPWSP
ncbi:hypothetical protein AGOR_G00168980 [Albula goreensis]|uniref:Uncharacterized protein n=1 Tax=Albula goreensis TaxID=1534307 RepID=A0A8T3D0W4_9TELE|nr:hypothetical protein AGOR_G00168980 [Albula goreensis]